MTAHTFRSLLYSSIIVLMILTLVSRPSDRTEAGQRAQAPKPTGDTDREELVYDNPLAAAEFYNKKRVPPGQSDIPVERYLSALQHIRRMPRYSTASGRFLPSDVSHVLSIGNSNTLSTWISLGPGNVGGRTRSLLISPRNPNTMYAGGVSGGVWKTTDGGQSWIPLNDLLPNLGVASMAMDQTDADVIYAGTGEGFFQGNAVRGLGIFKTTDGGTSWTHLPSTLNSNFYYVSHIAISPKDSQRVYAGTQTGVWRSTDGGGTWTQTLARSSPFGLDLAIRTDQATDYLFASYGDTVYRNTDAGGVGVWDPVLTDTNIMRTFLAIAPSNQNTVYALSSGITNEINGGLFALFRSTDGGSSWTTKVRNTDSVDLNTRVLSSSFCGDSKSGIAQYASVIAVDPVDPNRVWAGGVNLFRSDDGGANWGLANDLHPDHHVIMFHPQYDGTSNRTMFTTSDGGINRTDDARAATTTSPCNGGGSSVRWTSLNNNYGVIQFYHGVPYPDGKTYFGGTQDNGTVRGTDEDGANGWKSELGGDGGYVAVDPNNTSIIYAENQLRQIKKSTDGGATFKPATSGLSLSDAVTFITPFVMDASDARRLWTGGRILWRTTDGAQSWTPASAQLTISAVSALAVAPTDPNHVLAGTQDGVICRSDVALTANAATIWPSVRPQAGYASSVAFDPTNASVAYVTYSTFNLFASDHHVFKSTDAGATWNPIDGSGDSSIPDIPVHSIAIDPSNTSRLYVGTDLGVFVSIDGGASWAGENTGFANVVTESLTFNTADGITRLFAFTYGRGAWRVRLAAFVSKIAGASVSGKTLVVTGENFDSGAVILMNGQEQVTKNDGQSPRTTLIAKKGGKKIKPGQTAILQVRNADGTLTQEFSFSRP